MQTTALLGNSRRENSMAKKKLKKSKKLSSTKSPVHFIKFGL